MTATALGWFLAGISLAGFVTLWFSVSYRELSAKRKSLDAITEQVRLHRSLYMGERGGENDSAAKNMLESKLLVYREVAREYNALLKSPMLCIPGYILGFRRKRRMGSNNPLFRCTAKKYRFNIKIAGGAEMNKSKIQKENQEMQQRELHNTMGHNAKTAFQEFASMAGLTKTAPNSPVSTEKTEPIQVGPAPTKYVPTPPMEVSLITADVIVEGTTCTDGALDCRGTVKGDLIAKGAVTMSGKQTGNVKGLQILFSNASIEGNVTAKEHIEINHGTKIIGDVRGGTVVLNGQVTGLICADGLVSLRKNAVLIGDIQAGAISIEEGAQISGQIKMNLSEAKQPTAIYS